MPAGITVFVIYGRDQRIQHGKAFDALRKGRTQTLGGAGLAVACFCLVQARVGKRQRVHASALLFGKHGGPHGKLKRDGDILVRRIIREAVHPRLKPCSQRAGFVLTGAGQQQGELIAAEPRQRVAGTAAVPEGEGSLTQHVIAGEMSVSVVEELEVVEVDQGHRQGLAGALGVFRFFLKAPVEDPVVQQAGETILLRQRRQQLFGFFLRLDSLFQVRNQALHGNRLPDKDQQDQHAPAEIHAGCQCLVAVVQPGVKRKRRQNRHEEVRQERAP